VAVNDHLETSDVRLLVDIGFMALSAGLDAEAEAIFDGVKAARPEQEAGPLGLAMVQMARNDLDGAVSTLRALPPSDAVLTYMGLALARRGDDMQACELFRTVIGSADGTPFAELCAAGLKSAQGSPEGTGSR
jgi:hypothetical protein